MRERLKQIQRISATGGKSFLVSVSYPQPLPAGDYRQCLLRKIRAQKWVKDVGLLRGNFPNSPFKRGSRRLSKQRQSGLDHTEEDFSLT